MLIAVLGLPQLQLVLPFQFKPYVIPFSDVHKEAVCHVSDEAFAELKALLECVRTPGVLCDADTFLKAISLRAAEFFVSNKFPDAWKKITENQKISGHSEAEKAFHLWFDALQTRRFLHSISEKSKI